MWKINLSKFYKKVLTARLTNNDHNKSMNKMVDYAKCVTIRDLQVIQKKLITEEVKLREE